MVKFSQGTELHFLSGGMVCPQEELICISPDRINPIKNVLIGFLGNLLPSDGIEETGQFYSTRTDRKNWLSQSDDEHPQTAHRETFRMWNLYIYYTVVKKKRKLRWLTTEFFGTLRLFFMEKS